MDAIYLVKDGQQTGPFTRAQIDAMLASGEVTLETMAWYDGLPNWAALGTIVSPAVAPVSAPPAPAPIVSAAPASFAMEPVVDGLANPELPHLAKCLYQVLLAFVIGFAFGIIANVMGIAHAGLIVGLGLFVVALGVIGFSVYTAACLASALRYPTWGIVLLCIGLFIPCVSLVILLVLIIQAFMILKAAGAKFGLTGATFN